MVSFAGFLHSFSEKNELCFFSRYVLAIVVTAVGTYVVAFFQFTTVWTFVQTVDSQFVMSTTFVFLSFRCFTSWYCHLLHLLVYEKQAIKDCYLFQSYLLPSSVVSNSSDNFARRGSILGAAVSFCCR